MFCSNCGKAMEHQVNVCPACGAPLRGSQPDVMGEGQQPPPLPPTGTPLSPPSGVSATNDRLVSGYRVAGLGDRLIAIILDSIVIMGVFAVIGSLVASRWDGRVAGGFSMQGMPALLTIGLSMLIGFLYFWFMEGLAGGTIGKRIVGLQVRSVSGDRCTLTQSLVRNLLRIIDGLGVYLVGFLIALFSKFRQRLGDHLAKTVVVEAAPGGFLRIALVVLWLALIVAAIWGAYMIHTRIPSKVDGVVSGQIPKESQTSPPASTTTVGSGLRIVGFEFLESKEGAVRSFSPYKPGDKVFTRYNIVGYGTDDQGQISVEVDITVTDPGGSTMSSSKYDIKQKMGKDESAHGWLNFSLAPYVAPGTYKIALKARDLLRSMDNEYATTFAVHAPQPVASKSLELRDLQLSLSEDGPPVAEPVVKAGDRVYMTAKLAGMQFSNDTVRVKVAFQLLGPRKEVLFDKPDFLKVDASFPYHPPGFYIPISAQVTPPPGKKGVFTEKYLVTDLIGNVSQTYMVKFTLQ